MSGEARQRLLFVDDEPHVLSGLRNRLRRRRDQWDMTFVDSGASALEVLATSPVDMVVTDMRMPKMDGAALLARVKEEHPQVVRIVLSGQSDQEMSRRAAFVAHQFIAKPCDDGTLENVIERALALRTLIGDPRVRRIVGKVDTLPVLPSTYARLRERLAADKSSVADVAAIISRDPSVCAKLLQVVNSAFFGLPRKVSRIEETLVLLGAERTATIVLAGEVFALAPRETPGLSVEALQRHALAAAHTAAALLPAGPDREAAYTAALLHDLGKLVLSTHMPRDFARAAADAVSGGEPDHVAEARVFGVSHAEIGAYLLGLWGLPYTIVEAVANHHVPSRVPGSSFSVLAAVHVADILEHMASGEAGHPDADYLARVGVGPDKWEQWLERSSLYGEETR